MKMGRQSPSGWAPAGDKADGSDLQSVRPDVNRGPRSPMVDPCNGPWGSGVRSPQTWVPHLLRPVNEAAVPPARASQYGSVRVKMPDGIHPLSQYSPSDAPATAASSCRQVPLGGTPVTRT
jgi:hypothetical protein